MATESQVKEVPRYRRTTIYLSATDRSLLATLQEQGGLATMSDALRYAVRRCSDLQAQHLLLTEQCASLKGALAQMHEELFALQKEREYLLKEMQSLNEELQSFVGGPTSKQNAVGQSLPFDHEERGDLPEGSGLPPSCPSALVLLSTRVRQTHHSALTAIAKAQRLRSQARQLRTQRQVILYAPSPSNVP